jgi:hypothetical protein
MFSLLLELVPLEAYKRNRKDAEVAEESNGSASNIYLDNHEYR